MRADETLIGRAAIALNAHAPNRAIADVVRRPRGTVRAWLTGRRRPPLPVLEQIQEALCERARTLWALANDELSVELWRRRREPKRPPSGFLVIDSKTGMDRRNRRGRPRRVFDSEGEAAGGPGNNALLEISSRKCRARDPAD